MFKLRYEDNLVPKYMTHASAAADLKAREGVMIPARGRAKVPTGVWIAEVNWDEVPSGMIPELQVRARSGLSYKHGITLTNGIGTIDADYRDEICVLLTNLSDEDFQLEAGERVAQLALNILGRIPDIPVGGDREGGFGSTGKT